MQRAESLFRGELIPPGATVLCAVSGGADSVCLLSLCRELPGRRILCAHFDHGIRGEESRRDAAFVESLCRSWDIPFFIRRGDVPACARERGLSLETAGRELRYAFLRETAAETGADLIATAHNLNDNAETLLFRLARGTGLRGLTGIPACRDGIVRPMLDIPREAIESYLRERGISWVEDSSNALDAAARNRIRHSLLPLLESVHPGAGENIARSVQNLREDEDCLTALAAEKLRAWGERLPAAELLALPRAISGRVLRQWLGAELPRERVDALLALCESRSGALTQAAGRQVRRDFDELVIDEGESPALATRPVVPGERVELPEAGLVLMCEKRLPGAEIQSSFTTFSFPCDNICDKLSVTCRREGDRIALPGRNGTKTLKKLFIETRIPARSRESVPVIRRGDAVLAIYGLGQAEGSLPGPEEEFLCLRFENME